MRHLTSEPTRRIHRPIRSPAVAIVLTGAVASLSACGAELPTTTSAEAQTREDLATPVASGQAPSSSAFRAWHQGFESGTEGWYDAGTEGALGWCGSIEAVEASPRRTGDPAPSVGRGYAEVRGGGCNGYWSALGIPGGAPYAPGPDAALYSGRWPDAGYVSEVDVYLDPAWSGRALGTLGLVLRPTPYPNAILQVAATIMPRSYQLGTPHASPHWFAPVEAVPGEAALTVLGYRIGEAGWYTFSFLFGEADGEVEAAFELRGRRGPVLMRVDGLPARALAGPFKAPVTERLSVDDYGVGHLWFFDAPVELGTFEPVTVAIDEHRVRPGR